MVENIALTNKNETEIQKLTLSMGIAHSLVCRDYLSKMTNAEVIPLSEAEKNEQSQKKIRLFRVDSIVYDKFENINEKLNSLFCAMSMVQDCNLIMLLNNHVDEGEEIQEFYIGVSGSSSEQTQKVFSA